MRRVVLVFIAVLGFAMISRAQYLPTTGQPFQFAAVYNPAFTGIDPFGDVKLSYRSQFGGNGANSPSFFNALYQFRLNQPMDAYRNGLRTGSAIRAKNAPRTMGIVHGMGINLFDEQLGLMGRKGAGISYSFHFPVSESLMLAVGPSVMIENLRINADQIYLGANADPDPVQQQILSGQANNTQLNARLGAVLYSRSFFFGVSYLPMLRFDVKDAGWLTANSVAKVAAQTGVSFDLSETVQLKPSIYGVLNEKNRVDLDYGLKIFVRNVIWAGAMYRDTKTGVAQLGVNINKTFTAAYSYEMSTGAWQFGSGSHELVLGIRLNNYKNLSSYTW